MTVRLFGVKNDTLQICFEVKKILSSENTKTNLVAALHVCMTRTKECVGQNAPLLISLNAPFSGVKPGIVSCN